MDRRSIEAHLYEITEDHLSLTADEYDLTAYREAWRRAWADCSLGLDVPNESVEVIDRGVLEGRLGRDAAGRGWVLVAAELRSRRAKHRPPAGHHRMAGRTVPPWPTWASTSLADAFCAAKK